MPATSKKQARLFRAAAAGRVKLKGMSKAKAHEMVAGHPTKDLPESAADRADRFKKMVAAKRKGH